MQYKEIEKQTEEIICFPIVKCVFNVMGFSVSVFGEIWIIEENFDEIWLGSFGGLSALFGSFDFMLLCGLWMVEKVGKIPLIFTTFGKGKFLDFCNFWKRKIPLIFATFGKGKFHWFLQLLEKENFIDFCNFWKRKIPWFLQLLEKENSIDFCNFWKRKIPWLLQLLEKENSIDWKGKFHWFLQLLEKEISIAFQTPSTFKIINNQIKQKSITPTPPHIKKYFPSIFSD
jgi:hypothetical protein